LTVIGVPTPPPPPALTIPAASVPPPTHQPPSPGNNRPLAPRTPPPARPYRTDDRPERPRYERSDRPDGGRGNRSGRGEDRGERFGNNDRSNAPRTPTPRPYADLDEIEDDYEAPVAITPADLVEDARVGAEVLSNLLKHMQIRAAVTPKQAETTEGEDEHWTLEITGQDLGLLIGRRGETLAALQYITRLIASRQLGRRANIVIDVEGYKARRETMLKRLAKRMAEQAIQRGRTVQLEPMPPHERRIIHMTLRDYPGVTTESIGEGDHRKVTIVPRRSS
jgi:spoIIIJ-associated protein